MHKPKTGVENVLGNTLKLGLIVIIIIIITKIGLHLLRRRRGRNGCWYNVDGKMKRRKKI